VTRPTDSVRTNVAARSAIARAWADFRYASRRQVELQMGPVRSHEG
jgi:hypothetical protein